MTLFIESRCMRIVVLFALMVPEYSACAAGIEEGYYQGCNKWGGCAEVLVTSSSRLDFSAFSNRVFYRFVKVAFKLNILTCEVRVNGLRGGFVYSLETGQVEDDVGSAHDREKVAWKYVAWAKVLQLPNKFNLKLQSEPTKWMNVLKENKVSLSRENMKFFRTLDVTKPVVGALFFGCLASECMQVEILSKRFLKIEKLVGQEIFRGLPQVEYFFDVETSEMHIESLEFNKTSGLSPPGFVGFASGKLIKHELHDKRRQMFKRDDPRAPGSDKWPFARDLSFFVTLAGGKKLKLKYRTKSFDWKDMLGAAANLKEIVVEREKIYDSLGVRRMYVARKAAVETIEEFSCSENLEAGFYFGCKEGFCLEMHLIPDKKRVAMAVEASGFKHKLDFAVLTVIPSSCRIHIEGIAGPLGTFAGGSLARYLIQVLPRQVDSEIISMLATEDKKSVESRVSGHYSTGVISIMGMVLRFRSIPRMREMFKPE